MSGGHLSDLACLEWVRFEETRLAPESAADVRDHLPTCVACRRKVDGFAAMERSMHPYGTPAPVDGVRRFARWAIAVVAIAVGAVYVASLILS